MTWRIIYESKGIGYEAEQPQPALFPDGRDEIPLQSVYAIWEANRISLLSLTHSEYRIFVLATTVWSTYSETNLLMGKKKMLYVLSHTSKVNNYGTT